MKPREAPPGWRLMPEDDAGRIGVEHPGSGVRITFPRDGWAEALDRLRDVPLLLAPRKPGPPKGRDVSLAEIRARVMDLYRELGRRPTEREAAEAIGYQTRAELSRVLRSYLGPGPDRWEWFLWDIELRVSRLVHDIELADLEAQRALEPPSPFDV